MSLFTLMHSKDYDSSDGYAKPYHQACKTKADFNVALGNREHIPGPYTLLYGGHNIDRIEEVMNSIFSKEINNTTKHPAILKVAKDPIIKVVFPDGRVWISSVGCYDVSIFDVKIILNKAAGYENENSERMLLITLNGKILDDSELLPSVGCCNMEHLLYREQLVEHLTPYPDANDGTAPSDRVATEFSAARSLQRDWIDLKDLTTEIDEIARNLLDGFQSVNEKSKALCGSVKPLSGYTFERYIRDFPIEIAPKLADSLSLDNLESKIARLAPTSSSCPALIHAAIEHTVTHLARTNVDIADDVANCLASLLIPVTHLSEKTPFMYPHQRIYSMLNKADKSLNIYKDIRANKTLQGRHDLIERQKSLEVHMDVSRPLCFPHSYPVVTRARASAGDQQYQSVLR